MGANVLYHIDLVSHLLDWLMSFYLVQGQVSRFFLTCQDEIGPKVRHDILIPFSRAMTDYFNLSFTCFRRV